MPANQMPKVLETVSQVYPTEERLDTITQNRKKMGLEFIDLWLLERLINKSRRRIYIPRTIQQLAERLDIHPNMLQKSMKKLRDLDYVRKGEYKNHSFFIVDPLLINSGNAKQKAFKIKLWQEAQKTKQPARKTTQPKQDIQQEAVDTSSLVNAIHEEIALIQNRIQSIQDKGNSVPFIDHIQDRIHHIQNTIHDLHP
jgi:DNA-binding HxlR family transcriptional regulator